VVYSVALVVNPLLSRLARAGVHTAALARELIVASRLSIAVARVEDSRVSRVLSLLASPSSIGIMV
jgi:hypothetical protein